MLCSFQLRWGNGKNGTVAEALSVRISAIAPKHRGNIAVGHLEKGHFLFYLRRQWSKIHRLLRSGCCNRLTRCLSRSQPAALCSPAVCSKSTGDQSWRREPGPTWTIFPVESRAFFSGPDFPLIQSGYDMLMIYEFLNSDIIFSIHDSWCNIYDMLISDLWFHNV